MEGLSNQAAKKALVDHGFNQLPEAPSESLWHRFMRQFYSPLVILLCLALIIDLFVWFNSGHTGLPFESFAIALILLINASLGTYQESKSENAVRKLKQLSTPKIWTKREGELTQIPVHLLVPEDVIRLKTGDYIPADAIAFELNNLLTDESIVTGEAVPVEKSEGDSLLAGTVIVRGNTFAKITRTGLQSTLGKLATLIGDIPQEKTPLEKKLHTFSQQLIFIIISLIIILMGVGIYVEGTSQLSKIFLFTVALAVAAVPESLPAILTMTLSLGVERMAKKKAIVRRLSAVEALGSVTAIATDKTGTLTENKMNVDSIEVTDEALAVEAIIIANESDIQSKVGDPIEIGLLNYVQQFHDVNFINQLKAYPRISSKPFDSSWKYMRVTIEKSGLIQSFFKGAPEVLLSRSILTKNEQQHWDDRILFFAKQGYRALGLAVSEGEQESRLTWLGLVLFWDPPRVEVPSAIETAQKAGIRVIMLTGDHEETAKCIAHKVGIDCSTVISGQTIEALSPLELAATLETNSIYARVKPQHKLKIVQALQQNGDIVAVTGDGVNDAPALKAADVGISMGISGSEISREVSDLVLLDDNFATIVDAIKEGRGIYQSIKNFIRFLFSTNLSEVLVIVFGMIIAIHYDYRYIDNSLFLPLTAAQILWINLITDAFPALSIGLDRTPFLMKYRPKKADAPLLDRLSLTYILCVSIFITLPAMWLLVDLPKHFTSLVTVQTLLFLYLTVVQLFVANSSRQISVRYPMSGYLFAAILGGIALQFLAFVNPTLSKLLGLAKIQLWHILLLGGFVVIIWVSAELLSFGIRKIFPPKGL